MTKAFVLISTETGVEPLLQEEIKQLDGVKEVYQLFGEYDILAVVEENSDRDVQKTISWELRKIKGIRGTNTMIVAK
ncbi:MAG: Lrp/AsnC ligand binding domain-containing protein [Nitrososphaera sp.]|uniref:Lrp/AsnC ligand binding domain-containing protein n=1 Tax=Nitrososphaera sp. TaxID=1971748 RepID=UPI0018278FAC|nr:Lrp/AsnC ligand binding domain-containing protein [Nitrososphaera sp.]NWG36521.1 Lrp/AsnC ligand binding domain-containing protein [Nitrososphaera sp.]